MKTPPDPEEFNAERAESAGVALDAFAGAMNMLGREDEDTILGDFLCNIHHWCGFYNVDFNAALRRGRRSYLEETDLPERDNGGEEAQEDLTAMLHQHMGVTGELMDQADLIDAITGFEEDHRVILSRDHILQAIEDAENRWVDGMVQNEHDTETEGYTDIPPLTERIARWEQHRPANRRRKEVAAALSEQPA